MKLGDLIRDPADGDCGVVIQLEGKVEWEGPHLETDIPPSPEFFWVYWLQMGRVCRDSIVVNGKLVKSWEVIQRG